MVSYRCQLYTTEQDGSDAMPGASQTGTWKSHSAMSIARTLVEEKALLPDDLRLMGDIRLYWPGGAYKKISVADAFRGVGPTMAVEDREKKIAETLTRWSDVQAIRQTA